MHQMPICGRCGNRIPIKKRVEEIDAARRRLRIDGEYSWLTAHQWALFDALFQKRGIHHGDHRREGEVQSRDQIITAIWPNPDREPEEPEKQITTYTSQLRRKLKGCNLHIETIHGTGWIMGEYEVSQ